MSSRQIVLIALIACIVTSAYGFMFAQALRPFKVEHRYQGPKIKPPDGWVRPKTCAECEKPPFERCFPRSALHYDPECEKCYVDHLNETKAFPYYIGYTFELGAFYLDSENTWKQLPCCDERQSME